MKSLRLGWRVSASLEPVYWKDPPCRPGGQKSRDVISIEPSSLASHSLIIASSGAGKSFFLGRLLEELVLASKRARVLVLDPNSDFRQFFKVRGADAWGPLGSDGALPMTETSRAKFEQRWPSAEIRVLLGKAGKGGKVGANCLMLSLPWLDVSSELIGCELDPALQHDVFHCHEMLRETVALLPQSERRPDVVLDLLREIFKKARGNPQAKSSVMTLLRKRLKKPDAVTSVLWDSKLRSIADRPRFIEDRVEHYYVSRLRRYDAKVELSSSDSEYLERVRILDLPSFDDRSMAQMMVSAELNRAWKLAQALSAGENSKRHPIVVVMDEAHHLVPAVPRDGAAEALRQEVRRIVAEGRKYGLFLILASQRPEKLDDFVTAECENLALLRLSSVEAAHRTREKLQFDDSKLPFTSAAGFRKGIVALYGAWAKEGPALLATAGRRTEEGGRSLPAESW